MGIWYTTIEAVRTALDVAETARSDARIAACIESASRSIDGHEPGGGLLHRRFYPERRTQTFDWPDGSYSRSWRLWLGAHELVSAESIIVAGRTLDPAEYFLRPDDGPPFNRIEINLADDAAFASTSTHQRAISVTGVYAGCETVEAQAATLAVGIDAAALTVDVSDSSAIGTGSVLRVDNERMIVTRRGMLDTGRDLAGDLTASAADTLVPVGPGAAVTPDEVILIDAERMRVVDVAGNSLVVKRAWDGSVLAAHTVGASVFALRRLTVTRGALGTTADTHAAGATVQLLVYPGLVSELATAEALTMLLQGQSGYARTVGSGDNERESFARGLRDLRDRAYAAHGRQARTGAV